MMQPDLDFLSYVEEIVDNASSDYQIFLQENDGKDDINELEELLNAYNDDDLPIDFIADFSPRTDPDEWVSAAADWDIKDGKSVRLFLHAVNLEDKWGPVTFKKIIMQMMAHETIHWKQYDKFDPAVLMGYQSGYMKGVTKKSSGGSERDLMRLYLRDSHELMAYGHDLAFEMKDTNAPLDALRGPERYIDELPVYQRYREIFPSKSKQIKQLLKYTAEYFVIEEMNIQ